MIIVGLGKGNRDILPRNIYLFRVCDNGIASPKAFIVSAPAVAASPHTTVHFSLHGAEWRCWNKYLLVITLRALDGVMNEMSVSGCPTETEIGVKLMKPGTKWGPSLTF